MAKVSTLGVVGAAALAAVLLDALGARFVLIGGLAVAARSDPRHTRDVDLAVSVPDDAAAESLLFALNREKYKVESLIAQTRTSRLTTARLTHRATPRCSSICCLHLRVSSPSSSPRRSASRTGPACSYPWRSEVISWC